MTTVNIPDFVHLHVHTQYSLLDGAIRIDDLLQRVADFGMHSVATTDHGTMFGAVEFYEKATKAGIKPIIGVEIYVAPRSRFDKTPLDNKGLSHLILLAENQEGYRNLCKLTSAAQLEGFYYKPRIDKQLLREHSQGLIAMSACLHGEVPRRIRDSNPDVADAAAREYQEIFGENNFYLEVQNNGIDIQEHVNQTLLDMSQRLSIPLAASNDCHYLQKEDVRAHDVLLCIQTGKTVHDSDRLKFRTDQLYLKSKEEMHAYFNSYPDALSNTVDIAARCNLEFDFNTYHFPKFDAGSEKSVDEVFEEKVREGYRKIIDRIKLKDPEIEEAVYLKRLDYEIDTIKDMGFPGYFLIVSDFIRHAKESGVPVGPGRGSAAGSLVAYSLGITDLDPIAHGLIFERFLNPARKSMPDIDVDFCIDGREEIYKYVVERYGGGDYVAQIITFGKLKTKAVIRDVGRALDIPLREVDAIAKMVPDVLNISLDAALEQEPRLADLAATDPNVSELIQICRVLEGLPRHASTHAAGVVIADRPLVDYLPLYKGKKGEVVTQFDMKIVEKIGLVKFDFLGLRNLTVIANTLALIERQGKPALDLDNIALTDPATYRLLSAGDTTGVFQLESSGMKDLLVRLKPECFDDIIALVALYRPGPMESGMIDDYVARKHGRKAVEYMVPELEPILQETYGVIVYQEQVMKIAGELANYSMAEADDLRKAMGKKIPEIMADHSQRFVQGAKDNNIPADRAKKLFDLIEKFGGYGFNKSHSAAYALIAYQTAYLKAHYPVEFMASLLTSEMHSTDGVVKFIAECRNHDIPILPPDINASDVEFTVDESRIRFGLVAVKNVGESAIESIIAGRAEKRLESLFDFCERVDLKKVNKRVVESLIKCGAFDSTGAKRSQLMAALEGALEYGQRVQRERNDPQMGLFDMGDSQPSINAPVLPEIGEWDEKQFLTFEKESLGFYLAGHPLTRYEELLDKFTNANAISIKELSDGGVVRIGGLVQSSKVIKTKKGDLMAFVNIEDMHGAVEAIVFSRVFATVRDLLVEDKPLLIQGQVQKDEQSVKILADTVIPIDQAEETWTASVHLNLEISRTDRDTLTDLHAILERHPGGCPAFLHLRSPEKTDSVIALPDALRLKAGGALSREVDNFLGYRAVDTRCSAVPAASALNGLNRNGRKENQFNGGFNRTGKAFAILLAGGTGTRLWPVSRELYPKQLVKFIGNDSLVQSTIKRLDPLLDLQNVRVVCGEHHYHEIARHIDDIGLVSEGKIIREPSGRNTAPAILLAAFHVRQAAADGIMCVFPADHVIGNLESFHERLRVAIDLADRGNIVTFGIKPNYPETGYGYIEGGDEYDRRALKVRRFVEKPNRATAEQYIKAGNFFWNSGMFAFKASVLLEEFKLFQPQMLAAMEACFSAEQPLAEEDYERFDNISIDYAIMEKTDKCVVVPSDFGWSDIGSWKSLYDFLEKDESQNVIDGDVIARDTSNCFLQSHERLIAANCLQDLVVVETPDSIFVSDIEHSRDVKSIVSELKDRGRKEYQQHRTIYHPWGISKLLEQRDDYRLSELRIYTDSTLELPDGEGQIQHFLVVRGEGRLKDKAQDKLVGPGASFTSSAIGRVRIENSGSREICLIQLKLASAL